MRDYWPNRTGGRTDRSELCSAVALRLLLHVVGSRVTGTSESLERVLEDPRPDLRRLELSLGDGAPALLGPRLPELAPLAHTWAADAGYETVWLERPSYYPGEHVDAFWTCRRAGVSYGSRALVPLPLLVRAYDELGWTGAVG